MSEEVERRVLRVLINSGLLAILILALTLVIPSFPSVVAVIPHEGFTLTIAVALLAIIVIFFTALRIIMDLTKLIDAASALLLRHIPGFNPEKGSSTVRALKELMLVFIIALTASLISPMISSMPGVGGWAGLTLTIAALALSLILMYDAGKTLYAIFQSSIQLLIDRIASPNEKPKEGD